MSPVVYVSVQIPKVKTRHRIRPNTIHRPNRRALVGFRATEVVVPNGACISNVSITTDRDTTDRAAVFPSPPPPGVRLKTRHPPPPLTAG